MSDLLAQATAELYEGDPDEFTQRRTELATHARDSGEPAVAKQITALRKPTRAAWVLNQLARAKPDTPARLDAMAAELRTGTRIRELTQARNALIDELTRQAFAAAHLSDPPFALTEDVRATLGAALADPEVAAAVAAGTLVRAAHWAGFGPVPLAPAPPPRAVASQEKVRTEPAPPPPDKIIEAERAVADALRSSDAAAAAEERLEETVATLEAQLEQARERLALARREAYQAQSRLRRVTAELGRIRK
jgi:hypothetical protein